MRVRVLGTVDVVDDAHTMLAIGGPIQARLLAVLVAKRPEAVSIDDLIAQVWLDDADLPDDPVGAVRTYVARLRRSLGPDTIVTGNSAYSLGEIDVDATRFEELVDRARRLSGSPSVAEIWKEALDLWRGAAFEPHGNLDLIRAEATRLDELRIEATEAWFDARLAAGEGRELVAEVETAVRHYPLREGFRAQHMTVLARAGRQAEALRAFQGFRAELTEVGLGPSERLVELDSRIAAGEVPRSGARRSLRGYELGERVGEGAFAVVHLATQASVGRQVAIKQIRSSLADQPEFIRQFEAEAQLVARLEHPHIVPLYDFWREPGSAYLVMRFLNGGSLASRLVDGPADLSSVTRWVLDVASGLDEAHALGVIHRDVKPANILLDQSDNAYLSDFGIAVEEAERLDPEAWLSHGSPAYAPPEQLQRQIVGPTADVYALGVTVYEALAGQLPFVAETTMAGLLQRQLNDPLPLLRPSLPDLPAAIDTVIQRATAKQAADRYQRAGDFARDLAAAAGLDGDETLITPQDRNPYKGLRTFTEADALDFSGRERLVTELTDAVGRSRAVVVVGPSGSGKSSVVRAGLLPALRRGRVPGSDQWFITTMIPGRDPFADLTAALLRIAVDPPADVESELRNSSDGLTRVIRRVIPDGREIVIVVDQLEELFTLTSSQDREKFLAALITAVNDDRSRLRFVATIRADFYDRPLRHAQFADLVHETTVAVRPLAADELERAITQPAAAVGVGFEPGLIAEITADVGDQPGALPLLQYTLTELFDQREDQTLTRETYRRLGGLSGSIARRAEEIYAALADDDRAGSRHLFGRLVTLGEGTEDTRKRVSRSELGEARTAQAVIDAYGSARLLTFDRDPATREQTIEVAHEALLREWPRLRSWLDDDRDDLRLLHHLASSAAGWHERGRERGDLYRAGRLESASSFSTKAAVELNAVEADFLQASLEQQEEEQAVERRQIRRLRGLLGAVAVVAAISVVAGSLAFVQRGRANDRREEAELSALVNQSIVEAGIRPDLALLLAVEAYDQSGGSPEARRALLTALASAPRLIDGTSTESFDLSCTSTTGAGTIITSGNDGQLITVGTVGETLSVTEVDLGYDSAGDYCSIAVDPTGTKVAIQENAGPTTVFDYATGEPLATLRGRSRHDEIRWLDENRLLVIVRELDSERDGMEMYDATTGELIERVDLPVENLLTNRMTPDGYHVVASWPDDETSLSTVVVTEGIGGPETRRFDAPGLIGGLTVDPAGGRVLIESVPLFILELEGDAPPVVIDPGEGFGNPTFGADGEVLWLHQPSGITPYDLMTGEPLDPLTGVTLRSSAMVATPTGALLTLLENGQAELLDVGGSGGNVVRTIELGPGPWGSAYYPEIDAVLGVNFATGETSIVDADSGDRLAIDQNGLAQDEIMGLGGCCQSFNPDAYIGILERTMHLTIIDRDGRFIERSDLWPDDELAVIAPNPMRDRDKIAIPVAVGDDAEAFLAGSSTKPTYMAVLDVNSGRLIGTPVDVRDWPERPWFQAPIHPDGGILVFDEPGNMFTYDSNGDLVGGPLPLGGQVSDPRVTPDGSRAVVLLVDGTMKVVDLDSQEIVGSLKAPEGDSQLRMMPDGRNMVSVDGAGRALLYDLDSLAEIGYLLGDQRADFIGYPAGTDDDTVWIGQGETWYEVPLDPDIWRRQACDLAGRELTVEEWDQFIPGGDRRDLCAG